MTTPQQSRRKGTPSTAEILTRAAALGPRTFNAAERTVEAVFASGNIINGIQLALTPENVASVVGVPVMNAHDRSSIDKILGVVTEAWIVGNEALARIKFSERANPYLPDIQAGIITSVSVGFNMIATSDRMQGKKRIVVADKWAAREISLVPVGQDPAGRIRSEETNMAKQRTVAENEDHQLETQTEQPAEEQAPIVNRAAINQEIRSTGELVGLGPAWANPLIDAGATVEHARQAAFDALKTRSPNIRVLQTPTMDDPDFKVRAVKEAFACRVSHATPSDQAKQFMGLTIAECVAECDEARGLPRLRGSSAIIDRALGQHTTSDLPAIVGDAIDRTARMSYQAVASVLKTVARETAAVDFRDRHRIQISAAPSLQPVNESGEFVSGSIQDSEAVYRVKDFGIILSLSRALLRNDDTGALNSMGRMMGIRAVDFEATELANMVESPPTMADGFAVFSTQHGNIASAPGTISETTLSAARLAMRSQREPNGMLISVVPKYLLVPSALETLAEKTVSTIQATKVDDVNPFSALRVLVEPRLDASLTAWWMVADPAGIDGLEFAHLSDEPGPMIFTELGFHVDGLSIKCRLSWGAGWVEPRGWYKGNT